MQGEIHVVQAVDRGRRRGLRIEGGVGLADRLTAHLIDGHDFHFAAQRNRPVVGRHKRAAESAAGDGLRAEYRRAIVEQGQLPGRQSRKGEIDRSTRRAGGRVQFQRHLRQRRQRGLADEAVDVVGLDGAKAGSHRRQNDRGQ